jgi:hypothetical protein
MSIFDFGRRVCIYSDTLNDTQIVEYLYILVTNVTMLTSFQKKVKIQREEKKKGNWTIISIHYVHWAAGDRKKIRLDHHFF